MPFTDVQIRNLNGGQKPVKPGNEESGPPKVSKPKNRTKGIGATLAKKDEPKFIVTTKPYKMADGAGLYLEVDPSGGKYWRFKYRRTGKEKRIVLPSAERKRVSVRFDSVPAIAPRLSHSVTRRVASQWLRVVACLQKADDMASIATQAGYVHMDRLPSVAQCSRRRDERRKYGQHERAT